PWIVSRRFIVPRRRGVVLGDLEAVSSRPIPPGSASQKNRCRVPGGSSLAIGRQKSFRREADCLSLPAPMTRNDGRAPEQLRAVTFTPGIAPHATGSV